MAPFELACVGVIALTLVIMSRRRPQRELLARYGELALAGYLGEQSSIALYRFYTYADGWHARLGDVPLLVPLIWPLVVLSAEEVAASMAPALSGARRAALVALIVVVDASMVEVIAVRAGLWSWAEAGHLGVPIIGILGWGCFAFGASVARGGALLRLVATLLVMHALILATWWGLLRWTLRGELGSASAWAVLLIGLVLATLAAKARARGDGIPLSVAGPRLAAAALFFALLAIVAPRDAPLWLHSAAVALPYLVATRFSARSAGAPLPTG